jgi:hypothetical protein
LIDGDRARIAGRTTQEDILQIVAVHIADGEAGAELRELRGQQRLAREIIEWPFAMSERDEVVAPLE